MKPLLIITLCILTAGCAAVPGYPKRMQLPKEQLKELVPYFMPEATQKYDSLTGPDKWIYRDTVLTARILAVDLNFNVFEHAIAGENIRVNLYHDIGTIALGTAGVLVPAVQVKSVLAAVSAGLTGAKGAINKQVFFDQSMPVLLVKMQANRKEVLLKLMRGMSQPPESYPLMQGFIDLEEYYNAGTIPGALQAIAAQAGSDVQKTGVELRQVLTVPRPVMKKP